MEQNKNKLIGPMHVLNLGETRIFSLSLLYVNLFQISFFKTFPFPVTKGDYFWNLRLPQDFSSGDTFGDLLKKWRVSLTLINFRSHQMNEADWKG